MNSRTVIAEIAAAGALIGSYPLDWLVKQGEPYFSAPVSEPVILIHGYGGSRSNLLALAAYLRLAGFDNVSYLEYPRWQSIGDSAAQLGRIVEEKSAAKGAHLIGHSLGGTVARRYAAGAPKAAVRSLVTLGSPYSYGQRSPREIGIFGDDDPVVPAPVEALITRAAFARIVRLPEVGHLALIFHPEALRIIGAELRANRAPEHGAAAQ
ncbi:MAG: alpha/beta fold hydrolase [Candidatus Binatus sp.]